MAQFITKNPNLKGRELAFRNEILTVSEAGVIQTENEGIIQDLKTHGIELGWSEYKSQDGIDISNMPTPDLLKKLYFVENGWDFSIEEWRSFLKALKIPPPEYIMLLKREDKESVKQLMKKHLDIQDVEVETPEVETPEDNASVEETVVKPKPKK